VFRLGVSGVVIAVLGGFAGSGAASKGQFASELVQSLPDRVVIDWTRGVVLAPAGAAADLRAPAISVARIRAERQAREDARAKVAAAARSLAIAGGQHVGEYLDGHPAARLQFERAVERLAYEDVDYSSDGSVTVTARLPVEAVRSAVVGPVRGRGAGDAAVTALIVDATGVLDTALLALTVRIDQTDYRGPTVFYTTAEGAAADPRLGPRPVQARATALRGNALVIDDGTLSWLDDNPLVVIVVKK
jgi:hypothetical protein